MNKKINHKKYFPSLPILEKLIDAYLPKAFESIIKDTQIISVQHVLESTGSLIEKIIDIGFKPNQLFFTGKYYSTCQEIEVDLIKTGIQYFPFQEPIDIQKGFSNSMTIHINKFWNYFLELNNPELKNLIILDEGGYCLENIPGNVLRKFNVIGIEQTSGGIYKCNTFRAPVIDVARSVVKKQLEAPIISRAIFEKTKTIFQQFDDPKIGIIGCGALGSSLFQYLKEKYSQVLISDIYPFKVKEYPCAVKKIDLLEKSDIILGCTGRSCINPNMLEKISGMKILMSCSSTDVEFSSLIKNFIGKCEIPKYPLEDIHISLPNTDLIILKGGYPINFDRTKTSVPNCEIQLTRGLLISAVLQALNLFMIKPEIIGQRIFALDSNLQKKVANLWFENYPVYLDKISKNQFLNRLIFANLI